MAFLKKQNNAQSSLSASISDSDLSLTVVDASSFPLVGDFLVTLWDKENYLDPSDDANMEIVKVTGVSGSVFTIERAQEGTVAQEHDSGVAVEMLITQGHFEEIEEAIEEHVADLNNPHQVVADQVMTDESGKSVQDKISDIESEISNHLSDFSNPHQVDASQVSTSESGKSVQDKIDEIETEVGNIPTDKIEEGDTSAEVVDTGSDGHFKVTTEGVERLRVNASGNVGIGTTEPFVQLTVDGQVQFGGSSSQTAQDAKLVVQGESTGPAMFIQGHPSRDRATQLIYSVNRYGIGGGFQMYGDHTMLIGASGKYFKYDGTSGNVGIGTSAPSAKLHTISTTEQLRLGYDVDNYVSITVSNTGNVTLNAVGSGEGFTFSDNVIVPDEAYSAGWDGSTSVPTKNAIYDKLEVYAKENFIIACSDEITALAEGTSTVTFRMPYAFTLSEVRASLTTAQSSGDILTVDINKNGSSILSTLLTIDNTEKTSTTATTAAIISDTALTDDAEITIDIDQIGDGTAIGLKIYLIGKK